MNALDIILLILLIPGAVRGIRKGFLEQVISIAGLFLSAYIAYHFSNFVCTWLEQYIPISETLLHVIGFVLVLAGLLILVIMVAKILTKAIEMASLGWINHALGFVFSLVASTLVLSLIAILFDTVNTKFELVQNTLLDQSALYKPLLDLGYTVFPYLKALVAMASAA
ncbi:MAG: CvpA family protein [Bacteroidales bacterium]|nr:CvpA family protein [Bacteroidales bacterium]